MTPAPAADAAAPGAPRPAARVLRKGMRFYSRGLRAYCLVTDVDMDVVHFKTELPKDHPDFMATDCPLDYAVAHVLTGRWDLMPETT